MSAPDIDVGATSCPDGPVESWPVVELDGVEWHVAPVYVAPIARDDVLAVCDAWECDIPSADLVDAIWRAADLRLSPDRLVRVPNDRANGASMAAYTAQRERIARIVDGRPFRILAGTHKDFARLPSGRVDLYGWHRLTGEVIEPGATSHNGRFIDYSQGLRLVRRKGMPRLTPHGPRP